MKRQLKAGAIRLGFETGRHNICIRVLFMEGPEGSVAAVSRVSHRTLRTFKSHYSVARLAMRVQTKLTGVHLDRWWCVRNRDR